MIYYFLPFCGLVGWFFCWFCLAWCDYSPLVDWQGSGPSWVLQTMKSFLFKEAKLNFLSCWWQWSKRKSPRHTALSLCLYHICLIGQSELCGQAQAQCGMRQYQYMDTRDVIHWVFCMKIYHWQILTWYERNVLKSNCHAIAGSLVMETFQL